MLSPLRMAVLSSHFCSVHEVVVEKCEVMVSFESYGGHDAGLDIFPIEVVSHEHEYGTYALASKREDVADGFVQTSWLALKG